jgi:cell division protein FtsI/penicillin-binding protein 2
MLEMVVGAEGTARLAAVPGFRVGGKTGTSKKVNPGGGYYTERYTVSFAGLLPAHNPEFVCVVVIDDPQTTEVQRYGGSIAAPVFSRIAARTAAHMNLEPTEPVEEDQQAQLASGETQ